MSKGPLAGVYLIPFLMDSSHWGPSGWCSGGVNAFGNAGMAKDGLMVIVAGVATATTSAIAGAVSGGEGPLLARARLASWWGNPPSSSRPALKRRLFRWRRPSCCSLCKFGK